MTAKVLVVEDEEPLALLLRYNLESDGFNVDVASNGEEAELSIEENPPDLIVLDWMLPGVAPTGRRVEVAVVVIVKVVDGKVPHEHIYWDQASVLVQLGLLDPAGLPVSGAESARKVLDPSLPPRQV